MQNATGVLIQARYGRSKCGSLMRRYSSPTTVTRYHVQDVTEKKLTRATVRELKVLTYS